MKDQYLDRLPDYPNDRDFRRQYADWLQSEGQQAPAEYMRHRAEMIQLPVYSHRYQEHAVAAGKLEESLDAAWLNIVRDDDLSAFELQQMELSPCWTEVLPALAEDVPSLPVTESISACFLLNTIRGGLQMRSLLRQLDEQRVITTNCLARWKMPIEFLAARVFSDPHAFSFQAFENRDRGNLWHMYTPEDSGWWMEAIFTLREDWMRIDDYDSEDQKGSVEGRPVLMILDEHWALLTTEKDAIGYGQMANAAAEILEGRPPLTSRPLRFQPARPLVPWEYLPDDDNPACERWLQLFGPEPARLGTRGLKKPTELFDDPKERSAAHGVISYYLPRRQVETLSLRGPKVTRYLPSVRSFSHLIDLELTGFGNAEDPWQTLGTCTLPQLISLSLTHCSFDNDALEILLRFPSLRRICLDRSHLNDHGLSILSRLPRLEELDLRHTKVTDAGMQHLLETKLRYLTLLGCRITDAALETLGKLAQLEYLSLEETQVTNNSLPHLEGLKRLTVLGLANTRIDDNAVFLLARMKSLQRVSGLSSQAMVFLMDELPGHTAPRQLDDRFR